MSDPRITVLVVGATGQHRTAGGGRSDSGGGHAVRALVRDPQKARRLPSEAQRVTGDLTRPETLAPSVDGVDAIVFTHGSDGAGKAGRRVSTTAACATCSARWAREARASP